MTRRLHADHKRVAREQIARTVGPRAAPCLHSAPRSIPAVRQAAAVTAQHSAALGVGRTGEVGDEGGVGVRDGEALEGRAQGPVLALAHDAAELDDRLHALHAAHDLRVAVRSGRGLGDVLEVHRLRRVRRQAAAEVAVHRLREERRQRRHRDAHLHPPPW